MQPVNKIFPPGYLNPTLDSLVSPEKRKDIRRQYNKQHVEVSTMLQDLASGDSSPSELSLIDASFDSDIDDLIPIVEFSTPARFSSTSKSSLSKDIIGTVFSTFFGSRSPSRSSGGGVPATRSTDCASTVSSLNFSSDLPPGGKEQEGKRNRRAWAAHGKQIMDSPSPETIPSHELFLSDDDDKDDDKDDDDDDDDDDEDENGAGAGGDDEKDVAGDDAMNDSDFFVINDSDDDEEEDEEEEEEEEVVEEEEETAAVPREGTLLTDPPPPQPSNNHHPNNHHPTIMLEKSPSMQSHNDFAADPTREYQVHNSITLEHCPVITSHLQ